MKAGTRDGIWEVSLNLLVRNIAVMAEAHGGVQRLREVILQLAVRGKLVPQNSSDEPANVLLERIEKEKRRLYEAGKIRKLAKLSPVEETELPYVVPQGWVGVRLTQLGEFFGGSTPSKMNAAYWDGEIPWVSPKDMKEWSISSTEDHVTEQAVEATRLRMAPKGSVLIVARSGILRRALPVAIAQVACTVNQDIKVLAPYAPASARYIQLLLKGFEFLVLRTLVKTGTTVQSLKFQEFANQALPLPPLAEQGRIVAKVDQLMAICDDLEKQQQRRTTKRKRVNDAALIRLSSAVDDAEFANQWSRIRENFDLIYDVPETVADLRQAVLQLAVRGNLVLQDPSDEPTSVLLERIEEQRQRLYEAGEIKKPKRLPSIKGDEVPFKLPPQWEWVRLTGVTLEVQTGPFGSLLHKRDYISAGYPVVNPQNMRDDRIVPTEEKTVSAETRERLSSYTLSEGDVVLARRGEIGRCAVVPSTSEGWLCGTGCLILRLPNQIVPEFLVRVIRSPHGRACLAGAAVGATMKNLSQKALHQLPFGLPPLSEQRRIVTKVDQLMSLCDDLETQLVRSEGKAEHLSAAIAHHIAAA